ICWRCWKSAEQAAATHSPQLPSPLGAAAAAGGRVSARAIDGAAAARQLALGALAATARQLALPPPPRACQLALPTPPRACQLALPTPPRACQLALPTPPRACQLALPTPPRACQLALPGSRTPPSVAE